MNSTATLVITPTYQEFDNLPELTEKIWKNNPVSILIVDDASGDGTPAWVKNHPLYEKEIFLLERPAKLGLGSAYCDGFRWALKKPFSYIVQMDADLSHDPSSIPLLLQEIEKGADLVLASRYLHGVRVLNWPLSRLFLSIAAASYVRLMTRMPFTDPTGGFKCWRRELLETFDLGQIHSNGYSFQIEMTFIAWELNAKIVEVPITFEGRHAGRSKMSGQIAREAFWEVLRLAFQNKKRLKKVHHL